MKNREPLRCWFCGRTIIPGLEMWSTVDGVCRPCHRDCGVPKAQAAPERVQHLAWKYSTRKPTRKERKHEDENQNRRE